VSRWSIWQLINQQLISYRSLTSVAVTAGATVAAAAGDDDDDDDIADAGVTDAFVVFTTIVEVCLFDQVQRGLAAINRFALCGRDSMLASRNATSHCTLQHGEYREGWVKKALFVSRDYWFTVAVTFYLYFYVYFHRLLLCNYVLLYCNRRTINHMMMMMMMKLRYRGEHGASDFSTNRKFICDLLLTINTNLHPILTVSKLWLIIGQIFASDRECLTLRPERESFDHRTSTLQDICTMRWNANRRKHVANLYSLDAVSWPAFVFCNQSKIVVIFLTKNNFEFAQSSSTNDGACGGATGQRAVTPCGCGVKAGMVRVRVADKNVWSHCYTRAISERFRDKGLIIKRYINSSVYISLLL